ncbi:MAG: hypothetical protein WDW38_011468 [Sanguina aurantia]
MGHNKNASECEAWFNVGEGEVPLSSLPATLPDGVELQHVNGCHGFADGHPYMWSLMKDSLRRKYFSPAATQKPAVPQYRADAVNVAVHVRRGDVVKDCGLGGRIDENTHERSRCMPVEYVAKVIEQVVAKLRNMTSRPVNLQVFTEVSRHDKGDELDSIKAVYPTVGLNLDGSVLMTFHALMSADVLIMAHSSFSLMAAVYGAPEQLVIYDQFWHSGVPEWLRVKDGKVGGDGWQWKEDYLYQRAIGMVERRIGFAEEKAVTLPIS